MAKKKYKSLNPLYFLFLAVSVVIAVTLPRVNLFKQNIPCANSISCIKDLSGKFENEEAGVFLNKKINVPQNLEQIDKKLVLGQKTGGNKHIYVDLSKQELYAYEDGKLAFNFPVSTGKWGKTPTGNFKIWIKLKYTRMSGGQGTDYYNLPNVPYVMFFYNDQFSKSDGFSLHGAYWHNNFGNIMSHGCVNISPINAEKIYYWANPDNDGNITYASENNPGTPVTIFGSPPSE